MPNAHGEAKCLVDSFDYQFCNTPSGNGELI